MTRVVLADDQDLVREGLRVMLEARGIDVVAEATDGLEAVAAVAEHRPDVVLMDIRMPTMDGIAATEAIASADALARVLILTTYDLDEYVYRALRAGAGGFLLKTTKADRLADAVRVVAAGEALLDPTLTKRLIEQHLSRPPTVAAQECGLDRLTDREREVLVLVAGGLSNDEIRAALVLSEATVKSHINRILAKLAVRTRVQLVVLAYEQGLVVPGSGHR
jgi:DNA-binding NarL/FixJ family response regulator